MVAMAISTIWWSSKISLSRRLSRSMWAWMEWIGSKAQCSWVNLVMPWESGSLYHAIRIRTPSIRRLGLKAASEATSPYFYDLRAARTMRINLRALSRRGDMRALTSNITPLRVLMSFLRPIKWTNLLFLMSQRAACHHSIGRRSRRRTVSPARTGRAVLVTPSRSRDHPRMQC